MSGRDAARDRAKIAARRKAGEIAAEAIGGVVGTLSAIGAPDCVVNYSRWREWHRDLEESVYRALIKVTRAAGRGRDAARVLPRGTRSAYRSMVRLIGANTCRGSRWTDLSRAIYEFQIAVTRAAGRGRG